MEARSTAASMVGTHMVVLREVLEIGVERSTLRVQYVEYIWRCLNLLKTMDLPLYRSISDEVHDITRGEYSTST